MDTTTMRVLVVEPGKRPTVKEIETGLEPLQAAISTNFSNDTLPKKSRQHLSMWYQFGIRTHEFSEN